MTYSVDVIIPVRHRDDYDICERLMWKKESIIPDNFNFLVIDYGSKEIFAKEIEKCCERLNFSYSYLDRGHKLFNLSEARNFGILQSKADYLIFEDVDLKHPEDFYEKINLEIEVMLETDEWPFLVIPVTYLSQEGSEIAKTLNKKNTSHLVREIFNPDSILIEHHAAASSFVVCKRNTVISVGGFDESFEGWGFEDSDFAVRLLLKTSITKPRDFFKLDTRNYSLQVNWQGWRSLYRVFADLVACKGIYSFHIWHPYAEHRNPSVKERNHKIFIQNCKIYADKRYTFTPLLDHKKKKQLFLSKNPHSWNKGLFNYFDNPIFIDENFIDVLSIEDYIEQNNIECVVFNNPYGNPKRLAIYEKIKSAGLKSYVVERGALPWSIYVDSSGFCAESDSYSENNWVDRFISDADKEITRNYINDLKCAGTSLEPQSPMIGGANLRKKLVGDSVGVKILFIALQSPSDTTTNYFCGQIGSYSNFINEISKLPYILPAEWKVCVKNHPLAIEKFTHPQMVMLDEYHISDILECCDAVTLINSGVGVLAQIFGKYVYTFGQAFYACGGLNKAVANSEDLAVELSSNNVFDDKKSFKFINYLINDFYSFASWVRAERNHTKHANMSISLDINYRKVNIPREYSLNIPETKEFDLLKSPLFDRYRCDEYINRNNSSNILPKTEQKKVNFKMTEAPVIKQPAVKDSFFRKGKQKFKKLVRSPRKFFIDAVLIRA